MTEQTPIQPTAEPTPPVVPPPTDPADQEPFISPNLLLILSLAGFVVAAFIGFTGGTAVVGIGGLFVGIVCLVLWVLTAPESARSVFNGRTLRYGGLSVIITVIVIIAMIVVYVFVRNQGATFDLTEGNRFSLTEESQQAITGIGIDPSIPPIQILAFYGVTSAGARDQHAVLFDSYVEASGGKISYRFIDPDQDPLTAGLYSITRSGQIVVVAPQLDDNGQPIVDSAGNPMLDIENAEIISVADQGLLTNAILKVAASGTFNAYFLTGENTLNDQMVTIKRLLTEQVDWNVRDTTLIELTSPDGEFTLNDPNTDGEVVVSPGGSRPLSDQELQILIDYLNAGGSLVIFAGDNLNPNDQSLATAENLNEYLFNNFGLRINNDIVIDPTQAFQSATIPVATSLDSTSYITTAGINRTQAAVIFEVPHSITISDTPPPNVTVTSLIRSSSGAYAKTGVTAALLSGSEEQQTAALQQTESDPTGSFVLAASAENTVTGAKVVVFGSPSPAIDVFTQFQTQNFDVAINSLVWATDFDSFFSQIVVQQQQRPQDAPLSVTEGEIRNINWITLVVLPFGVLLIGVFVWWSGRERARG